MIILLKYEHTNYDRISLTGTFTDDLKALPVYNYHNMMWTQYQNQLRRTQSVEKDKGGCSYLTPSLNRDRNYNPPYIILDYIRLY